jgi:hypothetical protein
MIYRLYLVLFQHYQLRSQHFNYQTIHNITVSPKSYSYITENEIEIENHLHLTY